MRLFLSGVLILLVAGCFTVWPQQASGQDRTRKAKACVEETCHDLPMGFTGNAQGGCLANPITYVGYRSLAVWPDQDDGEGTTHKYAAQRTLCVMTNPPRTIQTLQCADWYLKTVAGGACDLLAGSYSGDMVE